MRSRRRGSGGRRTRIATRYHPRHMPDLVIVLVIVLILVLLWRGPKTLPSLGAALGRGVREARDAARTEDDDAAPPRPEDERRD